jgi:hypothetical protein
VIGPPTNLKVDPPPPSKSCAGHGGVTRRTEAGRNALGGLDRDRARK